jgi:hypothetical protein
LILLIVITFSLTGVVRSLLDALVFGGRTFNSPPCGGFTGCPNNNLLTQTLSVLWVALFWCGYGYFNRRDSGSLLRRVLHFASLAYGVVFLLLGVQAGLDLVLRAAFRLPITPADIVTPLGGPDVASSLVLGLLVTGVYSLWLRIAAWVQPDSWSVTLASIEAIGAALLAASFWWGLGLLLFYTLESLFSASHLPQTRDWTAALAFVITGIASLLLDRDLRWRSVREESLTAPRRGFFFALLGCGTLAGAIGGVVALYALGTFLLGSPFVDWPVVARQGLSAFVIGVVVVGLYLWRAQREHLLRIQPESPVQPQAPVVEAARLETIEAVLDALQAHRISRDEAASRIRTLTQAPPVHPVEIPVRVEG